MTTAWLDLRNCNTDAIPDILHAAAEHRIEAVISDRAMDHRQDGVQSWVALDEGDGVGPEAIAGADIRVQS